ncbi:MAG: PQQ-dependent sugar dehydrogenase [Shewanella sp.]|nr:PQQ-dependent sugar dehydrogenase [Shewanella sp.]
MITVSKGFGVSLYASGVEDAKQLALGKQGTLFVGSGAAGNLIALVDKNADGRVDRRYVIDRYLQRPEALAYHDGDLYVAERDRILRYANIEARLKRQVKPKVVYSGLPPQENGATRTMAFGPDGRLYLALGTPCNVCAPNAPYGSILAIDPDSGAATQVATGVRRVLGMDWSPYDQRLWFSDNSREWMGDNLPADEINRVSQAGSHFGFPFIHGKLLREPSFQLPAQLKITAPEYELPAHVSPAGIHFYRGSAFPDRFQQQLFVAEHGSTNRSSKVGYQVVVLTMDGNKVVDRTPLVSFLDGEFPVARPYSLVTAPDGALYISDDLKGNVYRLYYKGLEAE